MLYGLAGIADADEEAGIHLEELFLAPSALHATLGDMTPSTLAMTIYSASALGARSPRLLQPLLAASARHMAGFTGRELAAVITACAHTGVTPDRAVFAAWAGEVAARMQAAQARRAVLRQLPLGTRAVGFGAHAAPARAAAHENVAAAVEEEEAAEGGRTLSSSVLAVSVWALAKLGMRPRPEWLRLFCAELLERHAPLAAAVPAGAGKAAAAQQQQQQPQPEDGLGPQETHMVVLALARWARPVSAPPAFDILSSLVCSGRRAASSLADAALRRCSLASRCVACVFAVTQVPGAVLRVLRGLTRRHKPLYTRAERYALNQAFKVLREAAAATSGGGAAADAGAAAAPAPAGLPEGATAGAAQ